MQGLIDFIVDKFETLVTDFYITKIGDSDVGDDM